MVTAFPRQTPVVKGGFATACGLPLTTGVWRNILIHVGMGRPRGTGATFYPGKA